MSLFRADGRVITGEIEEAEPAGRRENKRKETNNPKEVTHSAAITIQVIDRVAAITTQVTECWHHYT